MRSTAVVVWLSMLCCVSVAKAGESGSAELCRSVAHDLWAGIATEPLHEQTPLAQLPKIARGEDGLVKSGQLVEFPYGTFADQVLFPVRLDDGDVYMGRMGRQRRRTGITGISVQ